MPRAATPLRDAEAAAKLYKALKNAERGSNEHGIYWQTNLVVEALRQFYKDMEQED